jgi:hypothetical protein
MSQSSANASAESPPNTPPAEDAPAGFGQIEEIVGRVGEVVSRVWPLRDYIAINPYAGIADRKFSDARSFLQVFSDCELLMPTGYYTAQYGAGRFTADDIRSALKELAEGGAPPKLTAEQIIDHLQRHRGDESTPPRPANTSRPIRTLAEHADQVTGSGWTETVVEEISRFCAAHYDRFQATWKSPWKGLPLYPAWRRAAVHDRNPEILGLPRFRQLVESLPHEPLAAIVDLLSRLRIPTSLWESVLLCQVFSLPGWSAWAKYCDHNEPDGAGQHLVGLLAIRLAYEAALAEATGLNIKWDAMIDDQSATFRPTSSDQGHDTAIRLVLLRASEIAFRNRMLRQLTVQPAPSSHRKAAQLVFCIDVRSERIRRHLESLSPGLETFGFAGFFAMPIEYVPLGEARGEANVPALIRPSFRIFEGVCQGDGQQDATVAGQRRRIRLWNTLWKQFAKSAVGCFSFVETTGLLYAKKLFGARVARDRGETIGSKIAGGSTAACGPTLRGLQQQGLTHEDLVDLAAGMLTNLGLTDHFARLVVLCGHGSQTTNNPLGAGLDCGACGGHSGEPNARFAVLLLNDPQIRAALADRGIVIPEDTWFLAGLHNTTTDQLRFFATDEMPPSHRPDLQQLTDYCEVASVKTRRERLPSLGEQDARTVFRRAGDWSEVRPEWGLSGNAAFIVGPRSMTRTADFDGRTFLHSYVAENDPEGAVLENIMTAPMVVAHWINMQYYASTVDNRHFGSGDKTIHNVVGGFGVLSGNGGDLMTGLPVQSLHNGEQFQHLPVRLEVVIAAPVERIHAVLEKYPAIKELADNDWLHLTAIDGGRIQHYRHQEWNAA